MQLSPSQRTWSMRTSARVCGGVDHLPAPDVDADVLDPGRAGAAEDEVAGQQGRARGEVRGGVVLVLGEAGDGGPGGGVGGLGEAGAVEGYAGVLGVPLAGDAELALGIVHCGLRGGAWRAGAVGPAAAV